MDENNRYTIIIKGILEKDLTKKLQNQLDTVKDLSVKITKFNIADGAIANLKKTIEAGLKNINVGISPTTKGGTTTGGQPVTNPELERILQQKDLFLQGGKLRQGFPEQIPIINTTYYLNQQQQLLRLTELYEYLTGTKVKYNSVTNEEGELVLKNIVVQDNIIKTYKEQVRILEKAQQARLNLQRTIESSPAKTSEEYQQAVEQINALDEAMHQVEKYLYGGGGQVAPFPIQEQLKDSVKQANFLKTSLEDTNKEWNAMQGLIDKAAKLSSNMTEDMRKRSKSIPEVREAVAQSRILGDMAKNYNDQLAQGIPLTEEQTNALNEQYKATEKARAAVGSMGKDTLNFRQEMEVAIKRTIEWSIAMGLVYGSLNKLKEGIGFINELDKSLTDIRIVSGMTADEVAHLAQEYNNLARELGSTTQAVAQGSLEFIRQGYAMEEAAELLRVTTMMSKLGAMDSVQATEIMISIINGFKFETSEMISVLDKLTQADNMAASSILEVGQALQRTAVSAQLAGVSFEEAVAMITTISEVTRKAPETIGESLKTIFARFQAVTMGKDIDDFGESISNVEAVLRDFGIEIRDLTTGQFRDFTDVLDELNAKWDTLGAVAKSEIATQMAGVRQRENLLVLMENYNRYKEIEIAQNEAAGLSLDRYGIYLDSVEAKTNQLKATWEAFWLESFSSDMTKRVLDFGIAILDVATKMGGLGDVLRIVIGLFIALDAANLAGLFISIGESIGTTIKAMKGLAVATAEVSKAQIALQATLGWVGLALIIGEVVYQVVKYVKWLNSAEKAQEDLNEATDKFYQSRIDYENELKDEETLRELIGEYEELSNKLSLTEEETERWFEVNRRIHELLPDIAGYYDESGRFILDSSVNLETILELEKDILIEKQKQYELDRVQQIEEKKNLIDALQRELDEKLALKEAIDAEEPIAPSLSTLKFLPYLVESVFNPDAAKELNDEINKLSSNLIINQKELELMLETIGDLGEETEDTVEKIASLRDILNIVANLLEGKNRDSFVQFANTILDLNEAFQEGEISATAYFATLAEKADNANLIELFEGNTEAAQIFFETLFLEGLQAIDMLDTRMQEGKISILEYMDGLQGTSELLKEQYESLLENADAYGLNEEQIRSITSSYEQMTSALSNSNQELINMRDTAELLFAGYDAIMTGAMKPATEEMISYYQQLSQAAWDYAQQSGFAFRDTEGQALESAEAIFNYLSGGIGNFSNFASQMTERTNLAVQQQKLAIQNVILSLANIIKSFKINFKSGVDGYTTIQFPLPRNINGVFSVDTLPIQVPNIVMSGEASLDQSAVEAFAATLPDLLGGRGGFTLPTFTNDIWSGGGGYQPPARPGGGGSGARDEDRARQEAEKAYQDLLKMTIAMLKDRAKQAKKALQDELKAYRELINKKKEDLDLMKEQRKEQNKIDDAKKRITSIEEEIAQLQFDTSEEGVARRLELEAQLAEERRALEDEQFDQSIENQKRALDEEYANFENYINDQIKALDDYLEREGEIVQEAMELIHGRTQEFYDELMEWNMTYGSGVAQDVVDAWQGAIAWIDVFAMQGASAVEQFAGRAGAAVAGMGAAVADAATSAEASIATATANMGHALDSTFAKLNNLVAGFPFILSSSGGQPRQFYPIPYHSGGFVGGMPSLPESEVFAKLLEGEYVATESDMYNFINRTLPTIIGASESSKSIGEININFDVEHLDREALPEIKNMVTKAINDTLVDAGFKRNPGSFGGI